ncbi:hypothetical protein D3C78_1335410 [compost metagenome]
MFESVSPTNRTALSKIAVSGFELPPTFHVLSVVRQLIVHTLYEKSPENVASG